MKILVVCAISFVVALLAILKKDRDFWNRQDYWSKHNG